MDYGFGGALVLHVGRQRGDKNPVSQCIAVVVATTAAAAAAAAAVTGGVVRQAGGASGWQRVGVWLVPSFVRSGRREGRSDDPETEGAQSAVSRAETVTVTSVAEVVMYILLFFCIARFLAFLTWHGFCLSRLTYITIFLYYPCRKMDD